MTDDQALTQYIESVTHEAKAVVCARHIEGYAEEFRLRYEAWSRANAEALSRGAFVAEARGMNAPRPPNLATFVDLGARVLESLPDDDRQRRCDELLSLLLQGQQN